MSLLDVSGISVSYGRVNALQDVSLQVREGEIVTVLGANGAGKSTLLKALAGILRPLGGSLDRGGLDPRRLAYLPQRQQPDRLSVFESVLLGRRPHMTWSATRRDLRQAERALTRLGLSGLASRPMDQLSGGEAQKVALARALAQEPAVLLMDEPTSSLDLRNQLELADLVVDLVRSQGLAAVVALHDLGLALRLADRVLLLKNGAVHADCPAHELSEEMVAQVYGVRVRLATVAGRPTVVPICLLEKTP